MTALGPYLALVLLAIPLVCAVAVVLVGAIGALASGPRPVQLPRAVARSTPRPRPLPAVPTGAAWDDGVTHVFDGHAFVR